jgi:hypothetical protein
MQTIANRSFGRKAFGPQRRMSPATKARNVAASIRQRIREQRAYSLADYGLVDGSEQAALVLALLASAVAA